MSVNKKIAAAALLGLLGAGSMNAAAYAETTTVQMNGPEAGKFAGMEKHACKGQNSCKGNGGGPKAKFGKNECKGHGSCATDGSK